MWWRWKHEFHHSIACPYSKRILLTYLGTSPKTCGKGKYVFFYVKAVSHWAQKMTKGPRTLDSSWFIMCCIFSGLSKYGYCCIPGMPYCFYKSSSLFDETRILRSSVQQQIPSIPLKQNNVWNTKCIFYSRHRWENGYWNCCLPSFDTTAPAKEGVLMWGPLYCIMSMRLCVEICLQILSFPVVGCGIQSCLSMGCSCRRARLCGSLVNASFRLARPREPQQARGLLFP